MRERRRTYELMFIISPLRSGEDEIAAAINRVQQSITNLGGEVLDVDHTPPWGRRKFAYSIRDYAEGEPSRRSFSEGYYVLAHMRLTTTRVAEFERALQLNDSVIRYLVTLVEIKRQAVGAAPSVVALADEDEEEELDEEEFDEAEEAEG